MKLIRTLSVFFLFTSICGCREELPELQSGFTSGIETEEYSVIPGVMTIYTSTSLAEKLLESRREDGTLSSVPDCMIIPGIRITSVRTAFLIGGRFEQRQRQEGLHRWFTVEYDKEVAATKAAADFLDIEGVELTEPVLRLKSTAVNMNDPYLSEQWHYCNTGQHGFTRGTDMKLQQALDTYGVFGSSDVTVAIIDGGVDIGHPDLAGNLWTNKAERNGRAGYDDDDNGFIDDVHGYNFVTNSAAIYAEVHGTHVAGTVSAVNNNGIGVCGVAGGRYPDIPGVKLMCLQIMDERYEDIGVNIYRVFQYAAENGANIAQNSWGYEVSPSNMPASEKAAIDYFIKYAGTDEYGNQAGPMKGGLVVFAAGNEDVNLSYPAAYEKVLSVAAIGPYGKAAYYTNYGPWVNVCAPGGDLQANYQYGGVLSTVPGSRYSRLQGTSMACPHVSGLAALVLSCAGKEGYTCDDLFDAIVDSTDPDIYVYNPGRRGQLGSGMIDAVKALSFLHTVPPDNHPPVITASDDSPFEVGAYRTSSRTYTSSDIDGDRTVISCVVNGNNDAITVQKSGYDNITVSISGSRSKAGEYLFTIIAEDRYGAKTSLDVPYSVAENSVPVMTRKIGNIGINGAGNTASFKISEYFEDADDEPLAVISNISDRSVVSFSHKDGTATFKGLKTGSTQARMTVSDTKGAATECSFSIIVRDASVAFDVYPNPARDHINIRTGEEMECFIEIFASNGTKVFSGNSVVGISCPARIDVSRLSPGRYSVRLTEASGTVRNSSFVKL